jgi:hypothetical protein
MGSLVVTTVTDARPRPPGRPASTPEQLEAQSLHRVAELAIAILKCLRTDGRGRYASEKQLRAYLTADGVQFSSNDLAPALSLLAATGALVRPETGLGQPRPGWLRTEADSAASVPPRVRLARLVVEVCRGWSTAPELAERLAEIDEEVDTETFEDILQRLVDCGLMKQSQRQSSYSMQYKASSRWQFGETDLLESDICAVLRGRDELGFEDEDQLKGWLREAGIDDFDDTQFDLALGHLLQIGRLQQPRVWERNSIRPTWLVDAKPFTDL